MIGRYIVERKSSALPLCIRAQNLAVESQNQVHGLKKCGSALLSAWGKKGRHPIPIATALPVLSPRAPGPLPSPPLDPEVRRRGSSKGRAQGAAAAGARVPPLLRVPRRRRSQVLRRAGGPHHHEQGLVCSRRGGGEDQGKEVLRTADAIPLGASRPGPGAGRAGQPPRASADRGPQPQGLKVRPTIAS
jgi:hypothetical protein